MSHKSAKRIRKKLHAGIEQNSVVCERPPSPMTREQKIPSVATTKRLLMRRKDPVSESKKFGMLPGTREYRGGAINHPLSERGIYLAMKKRSDV